MYNFWENVNNVNEVYLIRDLNVSGSIIDQLKKFTTGQDIELITLSVSINNHMAVGKLDDQRISFEVKTEDNVEMLQIKDFDTNDEILNLKKVPDNDIVIVNKNNN